jgi:hypothetical protein
MNGAICMHYLVTTQTDKNNGHEVEVEVEQLCPLVTGWVTATVRVLLLQCVHWGRLKSFYLFHGPRRSVEVQEGGKILRTLGLLIIIYYIVPLVLLLFTFYSFK